MASDAAAAPNHRPRDVEGADADADGSRRRAAPPLLVGVCMRKARWDDFWARGMVAPAGGVSFEYIPFASLAARLAAAPPLDAVLHKVTDDLGADARPDGTTAWWPPAAATLRAAQAADPRPHVVDAVGGAMQLADRWATADALGAGSGGVATPATARVPATTAPAQARTVLAAAGVTYPAIVKPRLACGTPGAHALAVAMDAGGLADALAAAGGGGARCDALVQTFVNHGGILWKVYVAGEDAHVARQESLPDVEGGGAAAAPAAPPPDPPLSVLKAMAKELRRRLCVSLFGFDVVVDAATGGRGRDGGVTGAPLPSLPPGGAPTPALHPSGALLIVDVNYFPSMRGMPAEALAGAVRAEVWARANTDRPGFPFF